MGSTAQHDEEPDGGKNIIKQARFSFGTFTQVMFENISSQSSVDEINSAWGDEVI